MSLIEKELDDIRTDVLEIGTEETGIKNFKSTGKLMAIWESFARVLSPVYTNIINLFSNQITWRSATGSILKIKALEMGVSELEPQKAEGSFLVSAYSAGSVDAGKWIKTTSGLRFKTTEETQFVSGEFSLPVQAEFTGEDYNILAGTEIKFTSVVQGIESISVPENWISIPGTDEEDEDSLRARVESKWDALGDDNRPSKYESLARNVSGVQDVKIVRTPRGTGSINIVISSTSGEPSETLLDQVRAAITDVRLIARDTLVLGITPKEQDFSLTFSGNASEEDVISALNSWILDQKIKASITMKQLYEDVFMDLDLDTFEFSEPIQTVSCSSTNEKILPGIITAIKEDDE